MKPVPPRHRCGGVRRSGSACSASCSPTASDEGSSVDVYSELPPGFTAALAEPGCDATGAVAGRRQHREPGARPHPDRRPTATAGSRWSSGRRSATTQGGKPPGPTPALMVVVPDQTDRGVHVDFVDPTTYRELDSVDYTGAGASAAPPRHDHPVGVTLVTSAACPSRSPQVHRPHWTGSSESTPPMESSRATRCPGPVRPHRDRPPADRLRRLVELEPAGRPSQSVEGGQTITQFWPLTGLKVPADKTAALDHPVLVAKMDNTASSQPQVGLSKADMVVEELVEGGLTRLAAFYYSDIPTNVGPIRSMRASDIPVVSPVHASMVTSGAAARTIALIKAPASRSTARAPRASTAPTSARRRTTCSSTSNEVAEDRQGQAGDAAGLPARGAPRSDLPKGIKATTIDAQFSGGHTTEWQFTNGSYHNLNSNAPAGDQFPATNVLVLRVREGDAGYLDPAGNHVPETLLTGKGNALLFHNGRMVAGELAQGQGPTSPITLTTKKGARSRCPPVTPGSSWSRSTAATSASRSRPRRGRGRHLHALVGERAQARQDESDRQLHPLGRGVGVLGGRHAGARRRHRAEEDPGERVLHLVVERPSRRRSARRARCRGRRRTSSAPPARGTARSRAPTGRPGSTIRLYDGCRTTSRNARSPAIALSHGSSCPVSASWI